MIYLRGFRGFLSETSSSQARTFECKFDGRCAPSQGSPRSSGTCSSLGTMMLLWIAKTWSCSGNFRVFFPNSSTAFFNIYYHLSSRNSFPNKKPFLEIISMAVCPFFFQSSDPKIIQTTPRISNHQEMPISFRSFYHKNHLEWFIFFRILSGKHLENFSQIWAQCSFFGDQKSPATWAVSGSVSGDTYRFGYHIDVTIIHPMICVLGVTWSAKDFPRHLNHMDWSP